MRELMSDKRGNPHKWNSVSHWCFILKYYRVFMCLDKNKVITNFVILLFEFIHTTF